MYLTVSIRDEFTSIYILTNSSDIHLLQTIYNVIRLVIITLHADGEKTNKLKIRRIYKRKSKNAYRNYFNQT